MKKLLLYYWCIVVVLLAGCNTKLSEPDKTNDKQTNPRYSYRGWNVLSNNRKNGLEILDKAARWDINHIELSHYQLCHFLYDMRDEKKRNDVIFFTGEAHKRGIKNVFLWEHAFYDMNYYPDSFKVKRQGELDFTHHAKHFKGGMHEQLDLDNPAFWQWVYHDYDSLLSYVPEIDGIVLTFIETGSYVIYQQSKKHPEPSQKLAMLVDSLANYFINKKKLQLTIRTFIYNQFEKETIVNSLRLIKNKHIKVMIKMVPHDWFLTYPYQDFVQDIPFPVVIEYDCGMEYCGENIIAASFPHYFTDAFRHYNQFDNVIGFCARTNRFETTTPIGTPGELNLYVLYRLSQNPDLQSDKITKKYLTDKYGDKAFPYLNKAYNAAFDFMMSTMYTLGQHTANHSRLNYHRANIYSSHTTGEWYDPDNQTRKVKHDVNKKFHNYKDVINVLSFPFYKTDTALMCRDICWVLDSGWLDAEEMMTKEFLNDIITEKNYGVKQATQMLADIKQAMPFMQNRQEAKALYNVFNRSLIFAKERRGAAKALYGYRLWCKDKAQQTEELKEIIYGGLQETETMLDSIDNYPVAVPKGQWRWTRDREAFELYKRVILKSGWPELNLYETVK